MSLFYWQLLFFIVDINSKHFYLDSASRWFIWKPRWRDSCVSRFAADKKNYFAEYFLWNAARFSNSDVTRCDRKITQASLVPQNRSMTSACEWKEGHADSKMRTLMLWLCLAISMKQLCCVIFKDKQWLGMICFLCLTWKPTFRVGLVRNMSEGKEIEIDWNEAVFVGRKISRLWSEIWTQIENQLCNTSY